MTCYYHHSCDKWTSCQLESCSSCLHLITISHYRVLTGRSCVYHNHSRFPGCFFFPSFHLFLLECTFWHQPYVLAASLSAETLHLNSVWEVFSGGDGASVEKELWCTMEVICWRMLMAYLRKQLSRNCGGGGVETRRNCSFGCPQAKVECVGLA